MNKKICLSMIVKNESGVILRCLESIKHVLDYWIIIDTGSTDGTQEQIKKFMSDLPGELHERPWISFEENRNQVLYLARRKADYILVIDADEILQFSKPIDKKNLDKGYYLVKSRDSVVDFYRTLLIDNHPGWKWEGVVHEALMHPEQRSFEILPGVVKNGCMRDSCRSKDPKTYAKDVENLEKSLKKEPGNSRTVFYLAQSYLAVGDRGKALKCYEQRAVMGDYSDEVFWSLYYAGCLKSDLQMDSSSVIQTLWDAYDFDPSRAEPLCVLSSYLLSRGAWLFGYLVAKLGASLPVPSTLFYIQRQVYEYRMRLYFACAAHLIARFDEACASYYQLLQVENLPLSLRATVSESLTAARRRAPLANYLELLKMETPPGREK